MRQGFNYVVEKLASSLYSLTDRGSLQQRLYGAFMSFHTLHAESFPEGDLREAWEGVYSRLTALEEPPPNTQGNVRYTLDRMDEDDAAGLARDILELYFAARREHDERSRR